MYIIKTEEGQIIAVSNTIGYQENGNALINNGKMAIAAGLFDTVEEVDNIPEGWEYKDGIYFEVNENYKSNEDKIKALESEITDLQLALAEVYEHIYGGNA